MSDSSQLMKIIGDVLQPKDAALRKQSEELLVSLRNGKPNELTNAYLQILNSGSANQYRNFAATQLRLCLSNFSPASYTNVWEQLTPEMQQNLKGQLFQIIYQEQDLSMKKHIADTIGEIAGSIISQNNEAWPDFKGNVWKLFQDQNIQSVFAGFYILESFLTFAADHFKENANDLHALFQLGFKHENSKLKVSALKCFESYLQVLDPKNHTQFQSLILSIYEAVYLLIEKDNNEDGLQALSEMLEVQPRFFKKSFKQLCQLLSKIFRIPNIEGGVRRMVTQTFVDYAQKFPAQFRKHKESLQSVIEMVFFHMVEISDEVTEEWMRPPEGYNQEMQDDQDFETTRFGMGAVDRLIYSIGQEEMLPVLSATIEKLLANNDWRYKYTAVMALSQIGEYIEDVQKISSVLMMIVSFLKNPNPMMRYAACHAIGQISDDMQPKFQEKYGNQIFPELVALLQNDPVPRVVSHSAAALTNFLQGMKLQQIEPQLDLLVKLLLHHSVNGISLLKESALSALSSTVQIAKEKYEPYLNQTYEILFGYFNAEAFTSKQYKQLKGQSIQTLTIIASSVGPQLFRPAANNLISLLIKLQSSQLEQTDPQKTYILAGWQRLCLVYGRQLASQLNNILPSLFVLVENVVKEQINQLNSLEKQEEEENDKGKDKNINTYETEEAEVAISMLNVFIEQLKELYNPYVQKTVNLLCNIIKEHPNEDVKEEACKCLPNLIIAVKIQNQPLAVNLAKLFMSTLVETVQKQYDSTIVITQLQTLKSVLEELGLCFLNEQQVEEFSKKMLDLLKSSDEKKVMTKEGIEDLDEEEKEMVDQQIKQEEEVQVAISELIGILFKTHKQMALGLANFLIYNILPKVFVQNQSQNMLKFGIFLIDDIVQFLGYQLLPKEWFQFGNLLLKYTNQKSCVLRQAACYGLGVFGENTPTTALNPETIQLWLNALIEAVKIPKGLQKEKSYGHCRDNGVASIGKILKAHWSLIDVKPYLTLWVRFLPLKFDKDEGMIQNQLLVDIMRSQPDLIWAQDKLSNTQKVLSIYGEIAFNPKLQNDAVMTKMKQNLMSMQNDQFFNQNISTIWSGIIDKHKQSLNKLMKS